VGQIGGALIAAFKWVSTDGVEAAKTAFNGLVGAIGKILATAGQSLIASVIDALLKVAAMIDSLPAGVGSGIAGQIRKAVGAMAMGGPVIGGSPYIVGEKGPELFVPGSNGAIVPNNQVSPYIGGSGGGNAAPTLNIYGLNLFGINDPDKLFKELQQTAGKYNLTLGTPR